MTILPSQPPGRARRSSNTQRQYVVIAVVAVAALLVGYLVISRSGNAPQRSVYISGPSSPQAAALIKQSEAAALAAGSVQASVDYAVGNTYTDVALSIGPEGEAEQFSTTPGNADADIDLVNGQVYVQANSAYLTTIGHLSASDAAADSNGQWLQVAPGSAIYASATTGVTLQSLFQELGPVAPYSDGGVVPQTTPPIINLGGGPPTSSKVPTALDDPSNFDVTVAAPHLPTHMDSAVDYNGQWVSGYVDFSAWGQPVQVAAPAGAVPLP